VPRFFWGQRSAGNSVTQKEAAGYLCGAGMFEATRLW